MTVTTIAKPEDRTEWLQARHKFFNASDAPALYGEHPFKDLADVAAEKLAPEPVISEPTEAMDRGNRLEPVLLEWWGDRHGVKVTTPKVLYVNGSLMATLDGEPVGSDTDWIEAKTTSRHWGGVPVHVRHQVVAQAAASGRSRCHVVILDASMQLRSEVIEPTSVEVDDVLDRAAQFMAFIELGMTPEGVELRASHIAAMFPRPAERFVDLDDDGLQAVLLLHERRQARLEAEKAEEHAKDAVARLLLDCDEGRYDGRPVVTWKATKPIDRTDWRALAAAEPQLVERFTSQVPGARRMIVKGL